MNGVITQNVDRLHHAAGNQRIVELHGALHRVKCLDCEALVDRDDFQERLLALNPGFSERFLAELRPDGDAELPAEAEQSFQVPDCEACGGVLMPDVVFFGGHVPPDVVAAAYEIVDEADALLIVGSSLAVYSGYRFAKRAAERGIPIAIVNRGETRADPLATVRVEGLASDVLGRLAWRWSELATHRPSASESTSRIRADSAAGSVPSASGITGGRTSTTIRARAFIPGPSPRTSSAVPRSTTGTSGTFSWIASRNAPRLNGSSGPPLE